MPSDSLYDECIAGLLSEILAFVDVFCEFLEVVVHSFFYYSKYYDHGRSCAQFSYVSVF